MKKTFMVLVLGFLSFSVFAKTQIKIFWVDENGSSISKTFDAINNWLASSKVKVIDVLFIMAREGGYAITYDDGK